MVLSIEFMASSIAGSCYTRLFHLWRAAKCAMYRDRPRTLDELKTAVAAYIRSISQADLQKVFANKIKRVQVCIGARGHHFQQRL
jgi:hypothetical protein